MNKDTNNDIAVNNDMENSLNNTNNLEKDNQKFLTVTMGCQMNVRDTEIMEQMLREMNYEATHEQEDADLILFNTCCIRETAENKAYGRISSLKKLKEKNPNLIIVVAGCMAQKDQEAVRKRVPHVDLVFGTHNLHQFPDLLQEFKRYHHVKTSIWEEDEGLVPVLPTKRKYSFSASVNIVYGCNNFCTYCIVPYVRGRERSRLPEDIIAEIKELVENGVKEVTLLGQNVNSYGKNFKEAFDFSDLLIEIDKIDGLERVRYMTSHPRDFSDKLIDTIAQSQKICEHFHLPIQSGSDHILKEMNRGYTREMYMNIVAKIRQRIPNASITTDIIVGFPGETDENFQETMELVNDVQYDSAFTFIFSPRSGTPAAKMEDQVPIDVKKERLQKLMELQNNSSLRINKALEGQILQVLVEKVSDHNSDMMSGRTRTNKIIIFPGDEGMIGKLIPVQVTRAQTWNLMGETV